MYGSRAELKLRLSKKQSLLVQLVFLQIGFYMVRAQLGYAIHMGVFISQKPPTKGSLVHGDCFDSLVMTISAQGRKIIRLTVHGDPDGDRIFQSALRELGDIKMNHHIRYDVFVAWECVRLSPMAAAFCKLS